MNKLVSVGMAVVLMGLAACTPSNPSPKPNTTDIELTTAPFSATVFPEDAHYKPGEMVNATLIITNTSSVPITIYSPAVEIFPQDNSSQIVFIQAAGKQLSGLTPGEEVSFNVTWNQADSASRLVERGWYQISFTNITVEQGTLRYSINSSAYAVLEQSLIQDELALRPYVYFFRLVPEGTQVGPSLIDGLLPLGPTSYDFSENQTLEVVFYSWSLPVSVSVTVNENKRDDKATIFTKTGQFTEETSKAHSDMMRPPYVTLYENHIVLDKFKAGQYVLTITTENKSQSIYFFVH